MIALILVLAFAAVVFAIGRFACPPHDRLPLSRLDPAEAVGTWARGCAVIASAGPLSAVRAGDGTPATGERPAEFGEDRGDEGGTDLRRLTDDGPSGDSPSDGEPDLGG